MNWVLVAFVFGGHPVKTDMVFPTLRECLNAEVQMRRELADAYNEWLDWARQNPKESHFPRSQKGQEERLLIGGACIPHGVRGGR